MGVHAVLQACSRTTARAGRTWRRSTAIAATACARRSCSTTAATRPAALLKPGDFDWEAIFGAGVRWFHSGGIFAALSETHVRADHRGMQAAQAARRGRVVRPELPREALEGVRRRRPRASSVLGAHRRARRRARRQRRGPAEGPRHRRARSHANGLEARPQRVLRDDRAASSSAIPSIKVVATTLREVHSTNRHAWSAVAWIDGQPHVAPTCELDVYDRVGGGDGFAAGSSTAC